MFTRRIFLTEYLFSKLQKEASAEMMLSKTDLFRVSSAITNLNCSVFVFEVNEDLQELLKKERITLLAANSFVDNPDNVIKDLKA